MKRYFVLLISIPLFYNISSGQKFFHRQELLNDADSLYSIINSIHPNMYANINKPEFEYELNMIKRHIKDSMNIIDFYNLIAPLVVRIGDGHTSMFFPRNELNYPHIKLFPFAVDIMKDDSSAVVINDYSESGNTIPVGAKIIEINGKKISSITEKMFQYTSGERPFFKAAVLAYTFTPLLYSIYRDSVFVVRYIYQNSDYTKFVRGVSYSQRYKPVSQTTTAYKNYSLSIDDEKKIAYIDFVSFVDLKKFRKFLDSAYTVIKEKDIIDIIIDVRQNGGGNSALGDEFFQYISRVPFKQFGKTVVKTSPRQISSYKENHIKCSKKVGIKTYEDDNLIPLRKNKLRHTGNYYLLTSNFTFSSAADFSWAFKYFKMGTVVGEETGGLAVCFGDVISQYLPNTKMYFGVSYKLFYNYGATDNDIHGTIPDYIVPADNAKDCAIDLILETRRSFNPFKNQ